MEKAAIEILRKMNKTQYYDFLKSAIGMKVFLSGMDSVFEAEGVENKNKKYYKVLGQIITGKGKKVFYVDKNDILDDYKEKKFSVVAEDNSVTRYTTDSYFDDVLDDGIVTTLLLSVYGLKNIGIKEKEKLLLEKFFGMNILKRCKLERYQFILGAGVNLDNNLKISLGSWGDLIDDMRNAVRLKKSIPIPPSPQISQTGYNIKYKICDSLIDLEESICNTNYIAPEILKDLDETEYYNRLYNNLYSNFNPNQLDINYNNSVAHTNLYIISKIMKKQDGGKVLTFNYDNVLELVYKNIGLDYQSVYNGEKEDNTKKTYIIHSHGFYPYCPDANNSVHKGIVLSTFEYLEGYFAPGKYARKKLTEQLKETNILIGNSVSDYEEQKVFFSNFKRRPSSWHFVFMKKSTGWIDEYKKFYFIRMGIIPVFFDNYTDITNYLESVYDNM